MRMPSHCLARFALAALLGVLVACSREDAAPAAAPVTLVTAEAARAEDVAVLLTAMGRVESRAAPAVAAEIDGRVLRTVVDAGAAVAQGDVLAELDRTAPELERKAAAAELLRIDTLVANETRRVERLARLREQGSIAREQYDDAAATLAALRAQRGTIEARLRIADDQLARTLIRAPLAGSVERRLVSAGDFVKRGTPLFELATAGELRAALPFPEPLAAQLRTGLAVRLDSPLAPGQAASGVVGELRPAVDAGSRAVWAMVDFANPGGWRPGATVRGEIVVAVHADAVTVPVHAVVRRPAGKVVYAIRDGRAAQRVVETGERIGERIEIRRGLAAGEEVALEGAAYLSDGAGVRVARDAP